MKHSRDSLTDKLLPIALLTCIFLSSIGFFVQSNEEVIVSYEIKKVHKLCGSEGCIKEIYIQPRDKSVRLIAPDQKQYMEGLSVQVFEKCRKKNGRLICTYRLDRNTAPA